MKRLVTGLLTGLLTGLPIAAAFADSVLVTNAKLMSMGLRYPRWRQRVD